MPKARRAIVTSPKCHSGISLVLDCSDRAGSKMQCGAGHSKSSLSARGGPGGWMRIPLAESAFPRARSAPRTIRACSFFVKPSRACHCLYRAVIIRAFTLYHLVRNCPPPPATLALAKLFQQLFEWFSFVHTVPSSFGGHFAPRPPKYICRCGYIVHI